MFSDYRFIFGLFSIVVVVLTFVSSYAASKIGTHKDIERNKDDIKKHTGDITEIYGTLDNFRDNRRTNADCNRMMDKLEEQSNFRDLQLKENMQRVETTITQLNEKITISFGQVISEIKKNGKKG